MKSLDLEKKKNQAIADSLRSERLSPVAIQESNWRTRLEREFQKEYMGKIAQFLMECYSSGSEIYPRAEDIFAALNVTGFEETKVIILGQDPYHGEGQAHGLSFSVPPGIKPPPSLKNIHKELMGDLGIGLPSQGNLISWAHQGVLLLNAVLTVAAGKAGSHQGIGWEAFTDKIVQELNDHRANLVFILWGNYAQKKGAHIDKQRHYVIESPHPSPFSAHSGFFGSRPFSRANDYLKEHEILPIDWGTII